MTDVSTTHRRSPGIRRFLGIGGCLVVFGFGAPAWAGAAFAGKGTVTAEPGHGKLELNAEFNRAPHADAWSAESSLTVGVIPRLEASLDNAVIVLDREEGRLDAGFGDTAFGLKYRLVDDAPGIPSVAVAVDTRLPTGDARRGFGDRGPAVAVTSVVGKRFESMLLYGNLGYAFEVADRDLDRVRAGVAMLYVPSPLWLLVAETLASTAVRGQPTRLFIRGGVGYVVAEHVRLEGGVARGVTRDSADWIITVGVTLRF